MTKFILAIQLMLITLVNNIPETKLPDDRDLALEELIEEHYETLRNPGQYVFLLVYKEGSVLIKEPIVVNVVSDNQKIVEEIKRDNIQLIGNDFSIGINKIHLLNESYTILHGKVKVIVNGSIENSLISSIDLSNIYSEIGDYPAIITVNEALQLVIKVTVYDDTRELDFTKNAQYINQFKIQDRSVEYGFGLRIEYLLLTILGIFILIFPAILMWLLNRRFFIETNKQFKQIFKRHRN